MFNVNYLYNFYNIGVGGVKSRIYEVEVTLILISGVGIGNL